MNNRYISYAFNRDAALQHSLICLPPQGITNTFMYMFMLQSIQLVQYDWSGTSAMQSL